MTRFDAPKIRSFARNSVCGFFCDLRSTAISALPDHAQIDISREPVQAQPRRARSIWAEFVEPKRHRRRYGARCKSQPQLDFHIHQFPPLHAGSVAGLRVKRNQEASC